MKQFNLALKSLCLGTLARLISESIRAGILAERRSAWKNEKSQVFFCGISAHLSAGPPHLQALTLGSKQWMIATQRSPMLKSYAQHKGLRYLMEAMDAR